MNFYDRALINARDEAILRQQSCHSTKSNMSATSSIKPSIYFKHSIASSRSNNYFQVRIPEEQESQQQQTPTKRFSPKRIRSLKERSLEFFNRTGSCSFKRDKIKSSMSHKSMMGYDPTIKSPNANIKGLSLNRLHNKKSDGYDNYNGKKELSCQIKCIFGSSAATITEDTTQASSKSNNNNNTDTNNFLTDSSLQNIEPLRNSDSFYLGEFLSVKL